MIKLTKVPYEDGFVHSCGFCLDCGFPVILKGKKVCDLVSLLSGGGVKQYWGECIECNTRFIIDED